MTDQSDASQADSRFSALLTPNRSLGPTGFLVLMVSVSAVSFVAGFAFYLMGAWPVFGFFGIDVALIYVAFRSNYRSGRMHELIDLNDEALTVTRVQPSGRMRSWAFNPYWVRVEVEPRVGRCSEMRLASHGRRLVFGAFLTDEERDDFAGALRQALADAKSPGVRL